MNVVLGVLGWLWDRLAPAPKPLQMNRHLLVGNVCRRCGMDLSDPKDERWRQPCAGVS